MVNLQGDRWVPWTVAADFFTRGILSTCCLPWFLLCPACRLTCSTAVPVTESLPLTKTLLAALPLQAGVPQRRARH